jgi:galactokinase
MTGAGFGGCAIALTKKESFNDFTNKLIPFYKEKIGYEPEIFSSKAEDGVRQIKL